MDGWIDKYKLALLDSSPIARPLPPSRRQSFRQAAPDSDGRRYYAALAPTRRGGDLVRLERTGGSEGVKHRGEMPTWPGRRTKAVVTDALHVRTERASLPRASPRRRRRRRRRRHITE